MILLDTHAWLWWASNPERLSSKAARAIERSIGSGDGLGLSSISAWEVAMLSQKNRLTLSIDVQEWIRRTERLPFVRFFPITNAIAVQAVLFPPPLHDDPADRIIAATACVHNAALITRDKRLQNYPRVKTIW